MDGWLPRLLRWPGSLRRAVVGMAAVVLAGGIPLGTGSVIPAAAARHLRLTPRAAASPAIWAALAGLVVFCQLPRCSIRGDRWPPSLDQIILTLAIGAVLTVAGSLGVTAA